MKAAGVTLTARAPEYARDGSQGYFLEARCPSRMTGWIHVAKDGRTVYATLDRTPWQNVGTVDSPAELTPAWITEHAAEILQTF